MVKMRLSVMVGNWDTIYEAEIYAKQIVVRCPEVVWGVGCAGLTRRTRYIRKEGVIAYVAQQLGSGVGRNFEHDDAAWRAIGYALRDISILDRVGW